MKVVWLVVVVLALAADQASAQERTFAIEGTGAMSASPRTAASAQATGRRGETSL